MTDNPPVTISLNSPALSEIIPLDGPWSVAIIDPSRGNDEMFTSNDYDDTSWKKHTLPHLRYATASRNVIWYRHHFQMGNTSLYQHMILRFNGSFYTTRVWLNGTFLGEHQGYFQHFGFDVSRLLKPGDNLLVVRCSVPVEADSLKQKTALMGVFADWDCKPYPSAYYPHLPDMYEWQVPLGLWKPVLLQISGPVLIESFNVFPMVKNPDWGTGRCASALIRVVLKAHNLTSSPQQTGIRLELAPDNFQDQTIPPLESTISLEPHEQRQIELIMDLAQPRLWFPWTHGSPHLYRAELSIVVQKSPPQKYVQIFGIRQIMAEIDENNFNLYLNGRRIFPRGTSYITDFYLDRATPKSMGRDLMLAREANLDFLRVHAHIASPELYELCDREGFLVMCDFPLIWSYASQLVPEELACFNHEVHRQAAEMVDLLGSHPAIIIWSMHNEPNWTVEGIYVGAEGQLSETDREIDESAARLVQSLDPTRPAIAASGQYDQHLYHGWYIGHWSDNRSLQPTFPSEFGVQALPNQSSPFWETVNAIWPIHSDESSWAYADYQAAFFENPGIGSPTDYPSLPAYIQESQDYQEFYIRYTIDQWRRKKFQPVGGYLQFFLNDCWPAISWSVLDYDRIPKSGYRALAESSRPTHVCIDLTDDYQVENAFHLIYNQGSTFKAVLYLVNDDYRTHGTAQLRWWITPHPCGPVAAWTKRWLAPRCKVMIPEADKGAQLVKTIHLPLNRQGKLTFHTALSQQGRWTDENRYHFFVGTANTQQHITRHVPGYLVTRIYEMGSLYHTTDGFAFRLQNPAVPVLVQQLVEFRVDNNLVDTSQMETIHNGITRNASTITSDSPLEFSPEKPLLFVVHAPLLSSGKHKFTVAIQLYGLGEIILTWSDQIGN